LPVFPAGRIPQLGLSVRASLAVLDRAHCCRDCQHDILVPHGLSFPACLLCPCYQGIPVTTIERKRVTTIERKRRITDRNPPPGGLDRRWDPNNWLRTGCLSLILLGYSYLFPNLATHWQHGTGAIVSELIPDITGQGERDRRMEPAAAGILLFFIAWVLASFRVRAST
jgi:hypothetical protein